MKIKSVKATWLHVPIPETRQHRSDFGKVDSFDSALIRIETESGVIGYGEAKAQVGSASTNHALCALIEQELGPQLVALRLGGAVVAKHRRALQALPL